MSKNAVFSRWRVLTGRHDWQPQQDTEVEVESASASCRILLVWSPRRCKIKSAVVVADCWAIGGLVESESEKLLSGFVLFFKITNNSQSSPAAEQFVLAEAKIATPNNPLSFFIAVNQVKPG